MTSTLLIVALAFIVESIVETITDIVTLPDLFFGVKVKKLLALAFSILLAFAAAADLFAMVSIKLNLPWLGCILTGLLMSRGSNFIHDILKFIQNLQQGTQPVE